MFKGRDSIGVRGIGLAEGDSVISMAILRHVEATRRRARRLSQDAPRRHAARRPSGEARDRGRRGRRGERRRRRRRCRTERYAELSAREQFILTVSENGYGKRTSSYEYRITGRGGKGITAMAVNSRNGQLVASFPVENTRPDHAGHRWRPADPLPVDGIRIVGRDTQGVTSSRPRTRRRSSPSSISRVRKTRTATSPRPKAARLRKSKTFHPFGNAKPAGVRPAGFCYGLCFSDVIPGRAFGASPESHKR